MFVVSQLVKICALMHVIALTVWKIAALLKGRKNVFHESSTVSVSLKKTVETRDPRRVCNLLCSDVKRSGADTPIRLRRSHQEQLHIQQFVCTRIRQLSVHLSWACFFYTTFFPLHPFTFENFLAIDRYTHFKPVN